MGHRDSAPSPRQTQALVELCRPLFAAPVPQPTLTIRGLGTKLGIGSTKAVSDLLQALVTKGFLVRNVIRRSYWPTEAGYLFVGRAILDDEWRAEVRRG